MKKYILFSAIVLLAGCSTKQPVSTPILAGNPMDNVISAAKELANKDNYSWVTTVTNLSGNGFRSGPSEGKTEKGGTTWFSMTRNDNTTEVVMQNGKTVVKTPDNGWQTRAEATEGGDEPGPAMFLARMLENFKAPAAQAEDLTGKAEKIKKDGDIYTGALTESGAKELLSWRRPNDDNGPTVSNAKGSVKFWVKDGVLVKFEFNLQGKINFGDNERDVNRTTTIEIKDAGSTKITIPDEAKKKLTS